MQKLIFAFALVLGATGCLSLTPVETSEWAVESAAPSQESPSGKFGVVRLVGVLVRSPYDTRQMPVLRADGSIAFDAYNLFAAQPSQLLRAPAVDQLAASGLFVSVLEPASVAPSTLSAEVVVTRLALDCREDGRRVASVRLSVRLVSRTLGQVAFKRGEATADASSGQYGAAFSEAFAAAMAQALGQL